MQKIDSKALYDGLTKLVNEQDGAFYKTDSEMSGVKYRVFNYRIPSWTQMNLPYAQEARGVMFDISDDSNPRLVCLTPKKFFNYKEGKPKEHEKYKLGVKMNKVDGSLLSTFEHNGKLFFKSKSSISSSQVKESLEILYADKDVLQDSTHLQKSGWTQNFEYISPNNAIVVPYEKSDLVLLSIRSLETGELLYADKLKEKLESEGLNNLAKKLVSYTYATEEEQDQKKLLDTIGREKSGEGYVIEVLAPEPYLVKVKNDAYTSVHNFLGKIESNFQLAKVILFEKADDARSLFRENPEIISRLENLEAIILPKYNALINEIESFHAKNKDLPQKEYVLLAQEEDKEGRFPVGLAPFKIQKLKNIDNVAKFCMENPGKVFGISDSPENQASKSSTFKM